MVQRSAHSQLEVKFCHHLMASRLSLVKDCVQQETNLMRLGGLCTDVLPGCTTFEANERELINDRSWRFIHRRRWSQDCNIDWRAAACRREDASPTLRNLARFQSIGISAGGPRTLPSPSATLEWLACQAQQGLCPCVWLRLTSLALYLLVPQKNRRPGCKNCDDNGIGLCTRARMCVCLMVARATV